MKAILRELWAFIKPHWPHLIVAVPMVVGVTLLHESAHALAVVAQGGEVIEFRVLPTEENWGQVRYRFDPGQPFSQFAVSVAPYAMWVGFMLGAAVLSAASRGRWPMGQASTVMVWGYLIPWGDTVIHWVAWLFGRPNDFAQAFGAPGASDEAAFALAVVVVSVGGYFVQRGLYGARALRPAAYGALAVVTNLALCAIA